MDSLGREQRECGFQEGLPFELFVLVYLAFYLINNLNFFVIHGFFLSEHYHIIINILCKKGNKKMSTLTYSFFVIYFLMITGLPATSR